MLSHDRLFRHLIGGGRSFPPEDCGGAPGFARVLQFREAGGEPDGDEDEDEELGLWLGDWQPEVDLERLRASFDAKRKPRAR